MADNKGPKFSADDARKTLKNLEAQGRTGFEYNDQQQAAFELTGRFTIHPKMKPWYKRVSHDSKKFPRTTANLFLMDVTGSQKKNPEITVAVFPELMEALFLLQENPAWCFATFGDFQDPAISAVSLQVGQFELDNMIEEWPRRAVLHGGGMGNGSESSEIGLWMAAYHMELHNILKREKDPTRMRGELILVTDDKCLMKADHRVINTIFEVESPLKTDVPIEKIIRDVRKNFIVTVLIPEFSDNGRDPAIFNHWDDLLGEDNVDGIALPNPVRHIRDAHELGSMVPALTAEHKELLGK